jgi:hypothetical protein
MRPDFYKILLERPRVSHYMSWKPVSTLNFVRNAYREAKSFTLDAHGDVCDMYCSKKMPMKSRRLGFQFKMFSENLNPLERYLRKQIGQPWDAVYSEISRHLKPTSTTQQHLRLHVLWSVHTKVKLGSDARVWDINGYHYHCDFINDLYVDPISGLLAAGTFTRAR